MEYGNEETKKKEITPEQRRQIDGCRTNWFHEIKKPEEQVEEARSLERGLWETPQWRLDDTAEAIRLITDTTRPS